MFEVGCEVVCISDTWKTWGVDAATLFPVKGIIYTVDGLEKDEEGEWLSLRECPDNLYIPDHFRKVQKTDWQAWLSQSTDYDEEQQAPAPTAPARKREKA